MRHPMQRLAAYLLGAVLACAAAASAYGQAAEPQPAARPLQVPDITLSIEDVAEVEVDPVLPDAELEKPEFGVPLPEADELRVVTPRLPDVLTDASGAGSGLLGPGLALEASVSAGNNGLLKSSIGLQGAGPGPFFHLQVDHHLQEGFGPVAPDQGYHRTDDLRGAYRTDLGGATVEVSGRYRRVEDGLQGIGLIGHGVSDQLVDGDLQVRAMPADALTLRGAIGGRSASRAFRGSDEQAVTEWQGRASAGATAQLRELEIGLAANYKVRQARSEQPVAHRLLGQVELGYDLPVPIRLGARAGLQYAPDDEATSLRTPFEVSVEGMPHDRINLRLAGGREVIDRDLAGVYDTFGYIEEPQQLRDTRQWFGDASMRAAVTEAVHVVASVRGETGDGRLDVAGDLGASGLHTVVQKREAGTLQTGLGLRWDISSNAALNLDWSGAFFDVPLYEAPHVLSLGMRATWADGRLGVENNVDWVFPNALETRRHQAPNVALPIISASGFYNISDTVAVVASLADLLQPLSDRPRYELAPYMEPGFQASVGVEINL